MIRREQMAALQRARDGKLAEWVVQYLRARHPATLAGLDASEAMHRALAGVSRARRHGFVTSNAYGEFIAAMLRHAPDFDAHPEFISRFAPREDETPDATLARALREMTPTAWKEVVLAADAGVWNSFP
ncbi:hypothetical protein [Pyxidicoccus caerfyrddinensis]|uniref:hypothetical protein n=1 Tax=Pyxidicoccus caerfyrddinensis TaxID=2709663 RepID=UPI0013DC0E15|nr:hypothetical protein [Pyxidicoccus caerfyrddinensis]